MVQKHYTVCHVIISYLLMCLNHYIPSFTVSGDMLVKGNLDFTPVSMDVDLHGNIWLAEEGTCALYVMSYTSHEISTIQCIVREEHSDKLAEQTVNLGIWCTKDYIVVRDGMERLMVYKLMNIWQ